MELISGVIIGCVIVGALYVMRALCWDDDEPDEERDPLAPL